MVLYVLNFMEWGENVVLSLCCILLHCPTKACVVCIDSFVLVATLLCVVLHKLSCRVVLHLSLFVVGDKNLCCVVLCV